MSDDRDEIELIGARTGLDGVEKSVGAVAKGGDRRAVAALVAVVFGLIGFLVLSGGDRTVDDERAERDGAVPEDGSLDDGRAADGLATERLDAVRAAQSIPRPLLAAELYATAPSAEGLRELLDALGGVDALQIARAEGVFDLVRFDPTDSSTLLASQRSSYGEAQNQRANEIWTVTGTGVVQQALWQPSVSHDFVHFNVDGTATMWVHGGEADFASRVAVALDDGFEPVNTSEPIYASRFTSANGTVFALTGNGDYYTNDSSYVALVADDGDGLRTLSDGARYGWIDNPTPELLLAYPIDREGAIGVWSARTLEPMPNHPLAGRSYRRVAISADGMRAVGATFDGDLEAVDLATGVATASFGSVDVTGVDQPITLNGDGTIAVTVEQTGRVSMWWIGDDSPIVSIDAQQRQPRWVSAEYAPRSTSVVSADASRVALLTLARAETPTSWTIIDIDPASWTQQACDQVGRALTPREAEALGLSGDSGRCQNGGS